jgi:hypothetical protein
MKDKAPKWAVREIENEFFENLTAKLVRGSRKGRATLTRGECRILLDLVRNRGRGRPPSPRDEFKNIAMAFYCIKREQRGELLKVAVAETAHRYGVSIKTVYAARQQLSSK